MWLPFKYEKLPIFCIHCGVTKHAKKGCSKATHRQHASEEKKPQYRSWLHATPSKSVGDSHRKYGGDEVSNHTITGNRGIQAQSLLRKVSWRSLICRSHFRPHSRMVLISRRINAKLESFLSLIKTHLKNKRELWKASQPLMRSFFP